MTVLRYVPKTRTYYGKHAGDTAWKPAVDIVEREDNFTLELDLPGFKKDDFTINVNDGVLVISGERKIEVPEDEKYFRHLERRHGTFERTFKLPEYGDGDNISASYKYGVLKLVVPKKEEAKPRTIKITE